MRLRLPEGLIIGQFGIGADGHIAGILPHSRAAAYLEADHTGKIRRLFALIGPNLYTDNFDACRTQ